MEPPAVVHYRKRGEGVGNTFDPQSLYPYRWSQTWTTAHEMYVGQRLEFFSFFTRNNTKVIRSDFGMKYQYKATIERILLVTMPQHKQVMLVGDIDNNS